MAELNTTGLEELATAFRKHEQKATEIVKEMLTVAADEYLNAEKDAAASYGIRKTGGFIASIRASGIKQEDTALYIEIKPEGQANHKAEYGGGSSKRKGKSSQGNVRYATIGFIFEYGTSSMAARPWLTLGTKKAEQAAYSKAKEVWDKYVDSSLG